MSNGRTNMISIRSDVYPETSLAAKKDVSGVPTVLYVDAAGQIQEIDESRNMEVMSNIVKNGMSPSPISEPKPIMSQPSSVSIPGTVTEPSELAILPGTTSNLFVSEALKKDLPEQPANVQMGGNLGTLIRTAGPAALLLGAYAAARSSGLSAPTRRRRGRGRVRFSRRRA